MSASRPSIDCDGRTGSQVIADRETIPSPDARYPNRVGGIVRMVGGLRLEWWAPSRQNDGRHQIGIGGRLTSESARSAATEAGHKAAGHGASYLRPVAGLPWRLTANTRLKAGFGGPRFLSQESDQDGCRIARSIKPLIWQRSQSTSPIYSLNNSQKREIWVEFKVVLAVWAPPS